jgi:Ca-activated chloride channel family protein
MGIFDEAPRNQAERLGPDLLAFATGITGGRTFAIRNLKRVGDAAAQLSVELRNQYLVAYRPDNLAHDGMCHNLTVQVTPPQNLPWFICHKRNPAVYLGSGFCGIWGFGLG